MNFRTKLLMWLSILIFNESINQQYWDTQLSMGLQDHLETIKPFVGEKENAIEAESNENETLLLTDRRLFSVVTKGRENEQTIVDSIHLDLVGATKIERAVTPDYDQEKVIYGVGSLFVALLALGVTAFLDGTLSALTFLVGFGVGLMGIVLLVDGYNPDSGSVTVELQSDSGSVVRTVQLGEDQLEFAEAISRAVSSNIAQPEEIKQKVGN